MTVKQLIAALSQAPESTQVVLVDVRDADNEIKRVVLGPSEYGKENLVLLVPFGAHRDGETLEGEDV